MTTAKKQDPSTTTKLELPDIPDEVEVKDYMTYFQYELASGRLS